MEKGEGGFGKLFPKSCFKAVPMNTRSACSGSVLNFLVKQPQNLSFY